MSEKASDVEAPGQTDERSFGLMRMGGALLALPVKAIREVIPGQNAYRPLPIKAEGLRGAVSLRDAIIPVLDLRPSLGLPSPDDGEHVVVIMRWAGRLIGLRADEVRGIARIKSRDLFPLETANTGSGARLATHVFQNGDEIATLLDAQSIAALPDVPLVTEQAPGGYDGQSIPSESILLFSVGRSHFGIDATIVDATVPMVRIEKSALASGHCLGVIEHHGFEVAVVDTTRALGLGGGGTRTASAVVVLRFPSDGLMGFVLDEVRDIVRVSRTQILALPAVTQRDKPPFRGMFADEGGRQHLLLDPDLLRADAHFALLAGFKKSRIAIQRGDATTALAGARTQEASGTTIPFLTYVAGAERATPLTQISEILTYPENVAPYGSQSGGVLGLFTHRGRVAPLVCLAAILDHRAPDDLENARVLVVEDGDTTVGFLVQELRSIETVSWNSPGGSYEPNTLLQALVLVGHGDQRRMMSRVDLSSHVKRFLSSESPGNVTGAEIPVRSARQA